MQEIAQLGFAVLGNKPLPLVRRGGQPVEDLSSVRPDEIDPFLSSTARLTANVSFQALSDEKHVFLFRQFISADHPDMVFVETSDGRVPVVDSAEPNAVALRQARNAAKKPPYARIFHRVTFISRVLPEFADTTMPPMEQALRAANIDSNWLLVQRLDPLVRDKTGDFGQFSRATSEAVRRYLPKLTPHADEIVEYLASYYGLVV